MEFVILLVLAVILLALGVVAYRAYVASPAARPLIRSFKSGAYCYPCASPIDAQWGTTQFIAAWASVPRAQRRFVFWNTSSQTMTVRSFTFGGYRRKYDGQVTEMIADNLMSQYGYSNVVPPGQVFSLDPENDAHVMYKGWYNSPIFIAYALGTEGLKYEVVGWAPMRLQDEVTKYKYFYDDDLKKAVMARAKEQELDVDAVADMLDRRASYELVRSAAIHWKTGGGYGGATYVAAISSDSNSQCSYVTELNTFDPVNVHVPLCHITVDFGRSTSYLGDVNNRAQCLRNIAMVAASKIMDSSADVDNFITEPDFEWGGLVAEAIGLAIYFYIEIGQTLAVTVTTILKTVFPVLRFPPISFALGAFVTAMFTKYRLMAVGAGVVGGLIPGIGDELQRIGMTAAGMSQNEWVNRVQQIASAQFAMQRAAMAAIGGNLTQSAQEYAANAATSMATAALTKLATKGAGVASEEVQKVVNESVARIVEDKLGEMDEMYLASVTQLVPKAKFRGRGKDDWDVGSPGRDKYALDRKLWVNRELQKGKFAKDAACTGFWNVTYHDKPNPNAKPDAGGPEDCTIL